MKTHKDLDVWKGSIELVMDLYHLTDGFPKAERYAITDQIRRAAISVPSNISEGGGRGTTRQFIQFANISLGSLSELETLLIIASRLNYGANDLYPPAFERITLLIAQLTGLIKALERKISNK